MPTLKSCPLPHLPSDASCPSPYSSPARFLISNIVSTSLPYSFFSSQHIPYTLVISLIIAAYWQLSWLCGIKFPFSDNLDAISLIYTFVIFSNFPHLLGNWAFCHHFRDTVSYTTTLWNLPCDILNPQSPSCILSVTISTLFLNVFYNYCLLLWQCSTVN